MSLFIDAWGTSWGHTAPGVADGHWAETWSYEVKIQPPTSSGSGGHTGRGARAGRFFDYPNIIDDGNLARLPPWPPPKKKRAPVPEPVEADPYTDPLLVSYRAAIAARKALGAVPRGLAQVGSASLDSLVKAELATKKPKILVPEAPKSAAQILIQSRRQPEPVKQTTPSEDEEMYILRMFNLL